MGTGPSTPKVKPPSMTKIAWAMPSWTMSEFSVNSTTIQLANDSWRYCMSGSAPPFHAARAKEPKLTPLMLFENYFYTFLFELLPEVRPMFSKNKEGMSSQGRMLANLIKYIITNLDDGNAAVFKESLQHLARVHNARGVTADHYSVMGMCLIYTVRICTGKKYFTNAHKDAWVHIYSKMMATIIPVVVAGTVPLASDADRTEQFGKSAYMKHAQATDLNAVSHVSKDKEKEEVEEAPVITRYAMACKNKEEEALERAKKRTQRNSEVASQTSAGGLAASCPASAQQSPLIASHALRIDSLNGTAGGMCPAGMAALAATNSPSGVGGRASVCSFAPNTPDEGGGSSGVEVSPALQAHVTAKTVNHIAVLKRNHLAALAAETAAAAAVAAAEAEAVLLQIQVVAPNPADKYKHLKQVFDVAQQVEMLMRDQSAQAISGLHLLALLESAELVTSRAEAIRASTNFLQFRLMHPYVIAQPVAPPAPFPLSPARSQSCVMAGTGSPIVEEDDDPTVFAETSVNGSMNTMTAAHHQHTLKSNAQSFGAAAATRQQTQTQTQQQTESQTPADSPLMPSRATIHRPAAHARAAAAAAAATVSGSHAHHLPPLSATAPPIAAVAPFVADDSTLYTFGAIPMVHLGPAAPRGSIVALGTSPGFGAGGGGGGGVRRMGRESSAQEPEMSQSRSAGGGIGGASGLPGDEDDSVGKRPKCYVAPLGMAKRPQTPSKESGPGSAPETPTVLTPVAKAIALRAR